MQLPVEPDGPELCQLSQLNDESAAFGVQDPNNTHDVFYKDIEINSFLGAAQLHSCGRNVPRDPTSWVRVAAVWGRP